MKKKKEKENGSEWHFVNSLNIIKSLAQEKVIGRSGVIYAASYEEKGLKEE